MLMVFSRKNCDYLYLLCQFIGVYVFQLSVHLKIKKMGPWRHCFHHFSLGTPRKTDMSPENQWLEDAFPVPIEKKHIFRGHVLVI